MNSLTLASEVLTNECALSPEFSRQRYRYPTYLGLGLDKRFCVQIIIPVQKPARMNPNLHRILPGESKTRRIVPC